MLYCEMSNNVQMYIECLTVSISFRFSSVDCTAVPDILGQSNRITPLFFLGSAEMCWMHHNSIGVFHMQ